MRRWGVLYFMLAVIAMIFIYPLSDAGLEGAIVFQVIYCVFLTLGVYFTRQTKLQVLVAIASDIGILVGLGMVGYAATTTNRLGVIFFSGAATTLNLTMIWVLFAYIFHPERIVGDGKHSRNDLIYAGITMFFLLAYLFTPIFNIVETLQPGSFAYNSAPDTLITWQRLIYFSFATLTTTGYGDISAITPFAQSLAIIESVTGVLYIAIFMSRLVSMGMQPPSTPPNTKTPDA